MKRVKYTYKELTVPEGCRELTDEEAFKINGGGREVENSNESVANAQPGDTVTRNDGTKVTLNQGDIDYAKGQVGTSGGASSATTNPATTTPGTAQNGAGAGGSAYNGSSSSGSSNSNATPTNAQDDRPTRDYSTFAGQDTPSIIDAAKTIVHAIGNIGIAGIFAKANSFRQRLLAGNELVAKTFIGQKLSSNFSNTGENPNIHTYEKDSLTKIKDSISKNENKKYNENGNGFKCDNWVEKVLDDAGIDSSIYLTAGKAAQKTCIEHIDALKHSNKDYTMTVPLEEGAYVVFMGDGTYKTGPHAGEHANEHCGLLINENNTMTLWDNSSGNSNGGVEPTKVYALTSTRLSDFTLYDSFYFQKVK